MDVDGLLRELRASVLFAPDFPRRGSSPDAATLAIRRAADVWVGLEKVVQALGGAPAPQVVPTLIELWRTCAVMPLRSAAGRALFALETPEAWDVLVADLEDADPTSRGFALQVLFARRAAYRSLGHRFTAPDPVAFDALGMLAPRAYDHRGTPLGLDAIHRRLREEPGWLDLVARLRRDPTYGGSARDVLRCAPAADRDAALARARAAEPPVVPVVRTVRVGDLLARYEAGAHRAVWDEIRRHEAIDGAFRAEVSEVARATMRRVAANADRLADRLAARGWRALGPEPMRSARAAADDEIFARMAELCGAPLPPALLAFWTVVGGVNLVWDYERDEPAPTLLPGVALDAMDPLYLAGAAEQEWQLGSWEEAAAQPDPDLVDPFRVELAPDALHKVNVSGGPPYAVEVPFRGADPVLVDEPHGLPLVDYLRLAFRWAGFPGLAAHGDDPAVRRFVTELGEGLEPF